MIFGNNRSTDFHILDERVIWSVIEEVVKLKGRLGSKKKKHNDSFPKETKNPQSAKRNSYLENLSGRYHLPEDVLLGSSTVEIVGVKSIRVENYKGIIEYTQQRIKLQIPEGKILIEGERMQIDYCTDVELHISGWIKLVKYD